MPDEWSSPSGSRWEPVPSGVDAVTASGAAAADQEAAEAREPRRSRRWIAAGLMTLLGAAGVATAGTVHLQSDRGTPGAPSGQSSSQVTGSGERGGHRAHGFDGQRPGGVQGRGSRSDDGTDEGDEPAAPSGNPS